MCQVPSRVIFINELYDKVAKVSYKPLMPVWR